MNAFDASHGIRRFTDPARSSTDAESTLLACVLSAGSRRELSTASSRLGYRVRYCSTLEVIEESLGRQRRAAVAGVILDVAGLSAVERLNPGAVLRRQVIPVLMLMRPESRAIDALLGWSKALVDLRISLEEADTPSDSIALLCADARLTPRLPILERAASLVDSEALPIVAAAAAIGSHATKVSELARYCGMSPRTLEARLSRMCGLSPKRLLMWMLALHSSWRLTRLSWTPKQVAAAAGCCDTRTLANRLERAVGWRVGRYGHRPSFHDTLDGFARALVQK